MSEIKAIAGADKGSSSAQALRAVFLCICILFGLIGSNHFIAVFIAFFVYLQIGAIVNKKSAIHMMFFLGYTIFIFVAALINWFYLETSLEMFFLSSLVSFIFLFLTKNTEFQQSTENNQQLYLFYIIFVALGCLLFILNVGYSKPYFAFCFLLMALCFKQGDFFRNTIIFSLFVVSFLFFLVFEWNGFGRTVTFGWLLLALLIYLYSLNIYINKYLFALAPSLASPLLKSRDIFNLNFDGFEASLRDSAFGPYRLAATFINDFNERGGDVSGFVDQIIFIFLVFIPRSIWPNKPYGFGFEYTVRHLDSRLIDAGHSIASTTIGDHIYFLGYWGVVTSLLLFAFIAWCTNLLYRFEGLRGCAVLIVASSMMVLSWGGVSSFSARIITPMLFFVPTYILFRKFLSGKVVLKMRR